MCGGYWTNLYSQLDAYNPAAQIVVGSAYASLGCLVLLVHRAVMRGRGLCASRRALLAGTLVEAPRSSIRFEGAALAVGLAVPTATAVLVSLGRQHFAGCLSAMQTGTPLWRCGPGQLGSEWPLQQLGLLGLGALCWLLVLPLAAVAFGLAHAHRRRAARIAEALAMSRAEPSAEGRYRRSPDEHERSAYDWLLMHPGPTPLRCVAVSLMFALLCAGLFAFGVVDTAWSLDIGPRHRWTFPPHFHPAIADAYAPLSRYAWGALAGLLASFVAASIALRPARPSLAPVARALARLRGEKPLARRLVAIGAPLAGACLCLLATLPLRAENAHPLAEQVSLYDIYPPSDLLGVQLPAVAGPDEIVDAPELVVRSDTTVLLDGMLVGEGDAAVAELEGLAARKRELWKSFHPNRPFPGVLLLSADRSLTGEQLAPILGAMRGAGFQTVKLHLDRVQDLAHPPLGVWKSVHRKSAVTVRLVAPQQHAAGHVPIALGSERDLATIAAEAVALRQTGHDVELLVL